MDSLRHGEAASPTQQSGDDGAPLAAGLLRASRHDASSRPNVVRATAVALSRAGLFGLVALVVMAAAHWLTGSGPHPLVIVSVLSGALVSGLAGFAFSAVAAALLAHWVAP